MLLLLLKATAHSTQAHLLLMGHAPRGAAHHARLIGVGKGPACAEGRGRLLENLLPRGEEAAQHARLLAGLPSGRLQSAGHSLLLLLLVEHSARSHTGHAHASDSAQRGLAEAGRAALGGQVQAVGPLFIANARRRRPTAREEAAEGSAARHRVRAPHAHSHAHAHSLLLLLEATEAGGHLGVLLANAPLVQPLLLLHGLLLGLGLGLGLLGGQAALLKLLLMLLRLGLLLLLIGESLILLGLAVEKGLLLLLIEPSTAGHHSRLLVALLKGQLLGLLLLLKLLLLLGLQLRLRSPNLAGSTEQLLLLLLVLRVVLVEHLLLGSGGLAETGLLLVELLLLQMLLLLGLSLGLSLGLCLLHS